MTAFSSFHHPDFHHSAVKRIPVKNGLRLLVLFVLTFAGLAQLPAINGGASADQSASYNGDLHLASGSLVDFPSHRRACERQADRNDGDNKQFPPACTSFAEAPSAFTLVVAAHFAALGARYPSLPYSPQAARAPPHA